MKDSYSFDRDVAGLDVSYAKHAEAYDRIFDRCGLRWYKVESDVGMMGGIGAHEYMAPCPAGENEVALSDAGYAANVEIATGHAARAGVPARRSMRPSAVDTPGRAHDRGGVEPARRRPGHAAEVAAGREARTARWCSRSCAATTASTRSSSRTRWARRPGPRPRRRSAPTFGAEPGLHRPGRGVRGGGRGRTVSSPGVYVAGANEDGMHLRGVRARAGLRGALRGHPHRGGGRPLPGRRHDPHRARDRGRQHLQARHAVLGGARRHVPGRGRQGAARS